MKCLLKWARRTEIRAIFRMKGLASVRLHFLSQRSSFCNADAISGTPRLDYQTEVITMNTYLDIISLHFLFSLRGAEFGSIAYAFRHIVLSKFYFLQSPVVALKPADPDLLLISISTLTLPTRTQLQVSATFF